jgi:hypothetical protein
MGKDIVDRQANILSCAEANHATFGPMWVKGALIWMLAPASETRPAGVPHGEAASELRQTVAKSFVYLGGDKRKPWHRRSDQKSNVYLTCAPTVWPVMPNVVL